MTKLDHSNSIQDFLDAVQKLTGVKSETIFTVCITIFVFGAGVVTNLILKAIDERRLQKNYKKTINLLLTNLSNVCKRQFRTTNKDLEVFSLLDNNAMAIKMHVYTPLQFLNKMDYSLFIKYYVRGFKKQIPLRAKAATKHFKLSAIAIILKQVMSRVLISFWST